MMVQPHVGLGFIAESFLRRTAIAPTNVHRKICSGMAGDFLGRTIAASFITARRLVPMGHRGASARSWSGGTRTRKNGPGWTILIIRKTSRRIRLTTWIAVWESQDWAEPDRSPCIRMAWVGFMSRAA